MESIPTNNFRKNFIAGKWTGNHDAEMLQVVDKCSSEQLAELPLADASDIENAIAGAERTFHVMRGWSAGKRREYLEKLLDLLAKNEDNFVDLIVKEAGKPVNYAKGEVHRAKITLRTALEESIRFDGEKVPIDFENGQGKLAFTGRFPIGPVTGISPFNFPLNLAMHKVAPALAVGNPIILKPSQFTPLTALALARIVEEAGYPEGTLSVLVTSNENAQTLVEDDRIKLFSFTGSPAVGWKLKGLAGKKKVILELGGNAAVIVDESVRNLRETAKTVAYGTFLYAGQICISVQRILVHKNIMKEFTNMLVEETGKLGVGDPSIPENTVGPVISREHLDRIAHWVDEAVSQGAKLEVGGKPIDREKNLYSPTLLSNVRKGMKVVDEEVFAPVGVLQPFSDIKEALRITNDSVFGLQAGLYTENIDHMKLAFEKLEVGGIMINNIPGFRIDNMPYGGVKDSGLGREGIKYSMEEMTEPRLLVF